MSSALEHILITTLATRGRVRPPGAENVRDSTRCSGQTVSDVAFLLAAATAFCRRRHAGGNDLASLRLITGAAALGLGSFAFHAGATPGAAVLDVGPTAISICSYLFLALHRLAAIAGFDRGQSLVALAFSRQAALTFAALESQRLLALRAVPGLGTF